MKPVNNRYGKNKRLTASKDITTLFLTGKAFFVFPYRVVYAITPLITVHTAVQMAPSVSKRKYKLAVKRNYIKRVTREAYRTQCSELLACCITKNCALKLIINYTHTDVLAYAEIEAAIKKIIDQLRYKVEGELDS